MEQNLNNLFYNIRNTIFNKIQEKGISIEDLSSDLNITSQEFLSNFNKKIEDFTFYLETLSIIESWDK